MFASSPESSLSGGTHYIFDCRYCAGVAGGKTPAWDYVKRVFGKRLLYTEGPSSLTLRAFALRNANLTCDYVSIDGYDTLGLGIISFRSLGQSYSPWHASSRQGSGKGQNISQHRR